MKLKNVSRRFNDDPIYDAYSGRFLFRAHTKAHDDQSSSGATVRRRTMRTVPQTAPPARRVVRIDGEAWLVGNSNLDNFSGSPIRRSYGLKKATGLMNRLTPAQACLGQEGVLFYSHQEFYRDSPNNLTESELDVMWNIFCPSAEPMAKGQFLRRGSTLYRIRSVYPTVDEYLIAETDELDADALQTAVFTQSAVLDVATDTMQTISVTTGVVQFDTAKFYRFRDKAENDRQPGDRAVFVPQSALTLAPGARFTMLGASWRAVSVQPEGDAWAVQARLG